MSSSFRSRLAARVPRTRTPRAKSRPRLAMSIWARGAWEGLGVLLVLGLMALVPVGLAAFSQGFGEMTRSQIAGLGGFAFLLGQGVPVHFFLPKTTGFEAVRATLSLVPLLSLAVLVLLGVSAGRRLWSSSSSRKEMWVGLGAFCATVALLDLGVGVLISREEAFVSPWASALIPMAFCAFSTLLGAVLESGGVLNFLGRRQWFMSKGQWWRWSAEYVNAILRAVSVAFLALLCAASLALAASLIIHWGQIVTVFDAVSESSPGVISLALAQSAYLPNLLVYALSWISGSGFSLGVNTLVSPLGTTLGALPPFPVLGAVPFASGSWGMALFAVPAVCAGIGAWWFLREGEDHLGDWLELKLGAGVLSGMLRALAHSLVIGMGMALLGALLAWLAGGSLGVGRLTQIGPDPLTLAWMLCLEGFVGALVGFLVVPWLESD